MRGTGIVVLLHIFAQQLCCLYYLCNLVLCDYNLTKLDYIVIIRVRSRLDSKLSSGSLLTVDAASVDDDSGSVRGRGRRRYSPAAALTRLRLVSSYLPY